MCDLFLEQFGVSRDERDALTNFADEKTFDAVGQLARLRTQRRFPDGGRTIADLLSSFHALRSAVGIHSVIMSLKDELPNYDWRTVLDRQYRDPVLVRNKTVWLAFQAALRSDAKFALNVTPARSHENTLSGNFIRGLAAEFDLWSTQASALLERAQKSLKIESLDMSVGGGEQKTGGDFAIIIDLEEEAYLPPDLNPDIVKLVGERRGSQIIPIIFQVKRYVGSVADISQHHKERGFQFDRLRQNKCASNYLFFENGERRVLEAAVPIVKPSQYCAPVEESAQTPVFEQSTDFATYLLWAINGGADFPRADSKEDALNMLFANANSESLSQVAILGNTECLRKEYNAALLRLLRDIEIQNAPSDEGDEPESHASYDPFK